MADSLDNIYEDLMEGAAHGLEPRNVIVLSDSDSDFVDVMDDDPAIWLSDTADPTTSGSSSNSEMASPASPDPPTHFANDDEWADLDFITDMIIEGSTNFEQVEANGNHQPEVQLEHTNYVEPSTSEVDELLVNIPQAPPQTNKRKLHPEYEARLDILLEMFPNADCDFLKRQCKKFRSDEELQMFILNISETQDYPRSETVAAEEKHSIKTEPSEVPSAADSLAVLGALASDLEKRPIKTEPFVADSPAVVGALVSRLEKRSIKTEPSEADSFAVLGALASGVDKRFVKTEPSAADSPAVVGALAPHLGKSSVKRERSEPESLAVLGAHTSALEKRSVKTAYAVDSPAVVGALVSRLEKRSIKTEPSEGDSLAVVGTLASGLEKRSVKTEPYAVDSPAVGAFASRLQKRTIKKLSEADSLAVLGALASGVDKRFVKTEPSAADSPAVVGALASRLEKHSKTEPTEAPSAANSLAVLGALASGLDMPSDQASGCNAPLTARSANWFPHPVVNNPNIRVSMEAPHNIFPTSVESKGDATAYPIGTTMPSAPATVTHVTVPTPKPAASSTVTHAVPPAHMSHHCYTRASFPSTATLYNSDLPSILPQTFIFTPLPAISSTVATTTAPTTTQYTLPTTLYLPPSAVPATATAAAPTAAQPGQGAATVVTAPAHSTTATAADTPVTSRVMRIDSVPRPRVTMNPQETPMQFTQNLRGRNRRGIEAHVYISEFTNVGATRLQQVVAALNAAVPGPPAVPRRRGRPAAAARGAPAAEGAAPPDTTTAEPAPTPTPAPTPAPPPAPARRPRRPRRAVPAAPAVAIAPPAPAEPAAPPAPVAPAAAEARPPNYFHFAGELLLPRAGHARRIIEDVAPHARRHHWHDFPEFFEHLAAIHLDFMHHTHPTHAPNERRSLYENPRDRLKLEGRLPGSVISPEKDSKLKLLNDLLPDANITYLKNNIDQFKDDNDILTFALKGMAEDNYPKWNEASPAEPAAGSVDIEDRIRKVLEVLPDACPTFVRGKCAEMKSDVELETFILECVKSKKYPTKPAEQTQSSAVRKRSSQARKRPAPPADLSPPVVEDPTYKSLIELLPDADPEFIKEESAKLRSEDEIHAFALRAIEEQSYPKWDEYRKRREFLNVWRKYIEYFDVQEFVSLFPDPVKYFFVDKKNQSDIPLKFLQFRYKKTCLSIYYHHYQKANFSLTKTCAQLDMTFKNSRGVPRLYRKWDEKTTFSTQVVQEIAFIQNKSAIAQYILKRDQEKEAAFKKAQAAGELLECGCCYDEMLEEDSITCDDSHVFCKSCVKRGSEVVIGNNETNFPCYTEGCLVNFSLEALKQVLQPEVFSRLLTRKQYEEVNAAGIPGLETCQFCEFCTIPANEDKIFRCLNPICMKVTCRSCKKMDHLPLTCKEASDKETQNKMRQYVEDKMTEALVRSCWKCGTKFVKDFGCNMMHCKCGAKMCYVCREPVTDYNHFTLGRCTQDSDMNVLHVKDVREVGKKAKVEVEKANPGVKLIHDPTKDIK